jgi:hypothetical protein
MADEDIIGTPTYGYRDVVTFSLDRTKIPAEVQTKFPEKFDVETGEFLVTKIPTRVNGIKSLSLVRTVSQQDLDDLNSITALEVLGTYEEMFADPAMMAKYDGVYDRTTVNGTFEEPWITYVQETNDEEVMFQEREVLGQDEEGNDILGRWRTVIRTVPVTRDTETILDQGVNVVPFSFTPPDRLGEFF